MMKRNFVFFLLIAGLVIGFSSCLGDGDNKSSYYDYGVVSYNSAMGGRTLLTSMGEFAAPGLPSTLTTDDCVYTYLELDFDNQPSPGYYTITNLNPVVIDRTSIRITDADTEGTIYLDTLVAASTPVYSPVFNGRVFMQFAYNAYPETNLMYEIRCNPEVETTAGEKDIYVCVKHGEPGKGGISQLIDTHAFDIRELIHRYGEEVTVSETNKGLKLSVNFYICTKLDKDGEPVYTKTASKATEFLIYTSSILQ